MKPVLEAAKYMVIAFRSHNTTAARFLNLSLVWSQYKQYNVAVDPEVRDAIVDRYCSYDISPI